MTAPPPDAEGGGAPSDLVISIRNVGARPTDREDEFALELETSRGTLNGVLHPCQGKTGCAIFVGGTAGGVDGPGGLFADTARELAERGVTSLRLEYREAGEFSECVLDALAGCSFLKGIGGERAVLVGHSFGGAVVIKAAELAPLVTAVAGLSSQRLGAQDIGRLGKPVLLVHGAEDRVLPVEVANEIYSHAAEPKRLEVLAGGRHGLREVADQARALLVDYVVDAVGEDPLEPPPGGEAEDEEARS